MSVLNTRASGILLHPTSLPGRYGIGDLGAAAYRFVDYLEQAAQSFWQILPLGPTGYGESPYQCLSAFAGNTLLISLDQLAERGWLDRAELDSAPDFPQRIDYPWVMHYHEQMLSKAYTGYLAHRTSEDQNAFEEWFLANQDWAQDFALFMALKESHNLSEWTSWPEEEANYKLAMPAQIDKHRERFEHHLFRQWVFSMQWHALKYYANSKGIRLIGDLPIFVAHDSSDVWARRELFFLDSKGMPPVVTGVPPDSFNPEAGQRWGHPVYYWARHKATDFRWWISRVEATLRQVDVVRIDHFRGFWDYFEVPATDLYTTKNGRWVDGPRDAFFEALGPQLQSQIIAEDLGDNMDEVVRWRARLGLPGMKILQFAFGGSEEEQARFGPDRMEMNSVAYTGTHDNRTSLGWWDVEATPDMQQRVTQIAERMQDHWVKKYAVEDFDPATISADLSHPSWLLIHIGMMAGANTLVIPLQDVLEVDDSGRQNSPGDPDLSRNWRWRYADGDLTAESAASLRALTIYYMREPKG